MQVSKLLVSNLSITEDEYNFGGSFLLSDGNNSLRVDIADLEDSIKLESIRTLFDLDEEYIEIRSYLMSEIIDKSSISSRNKEGESYGNNSNDNISGELDMA